ncbi:MAG: hypothetical protein FWE48_03230 [Coriobacteriia bacterium]|nr:hypothetical protein [Coriobacteriia bacterium]MCL2746088.1 hypothetical protein [Coriobacteriia bacterium]MCL2870668.1 hypothetical protein [Coriobacteriia bacterium]
MKTSKLFKLPERRNILLVQRGLREKDLKKRAEVQNKKAKITHRRQKREQVLTSPFMKVCGGAGNLLWVLTMSLVLTLIASYLAINPHFFEVITSPIEQLFSANIAGATPVVNEKDHLTSQVELEIEREFDISYMGKENQIIQTIGLSRKHYSGGQDRILTLKKLEVTPVIGHFSDRVDKVIEFDNLPTNDVAQLPLKRNFTLRSDKEMGLKAEVSLHAAEWRWETQDYDVFHLPNAYKAFVTYRGEEHWLDYSVLRVKAFYAGQKTGESSASPPQSAKVSDHERPYRESRNGLQALGHSREVVEQPVQSVISEPEVILHEPIIEEDPSNTAEQNETVTASGADAEARVESDSSLLLPAAAGLAVAAAAGGTAVTIFYRRRKKKQESLQDTGF